MSSAGRATGVSARRRTAGVSRTASRLYDGPTLASRLRREQRAWLARLNRPDTVLDMVRAVHATHEPAAIAQALVQRASQWIPLTCWAVVCADHQEQLSVIAEAGIVPDFGPALYGVADWVMRHQQVFLSGDLRSEARIAVRQPTAVIAWPLRGRDQVAGVLVGLDRAVSSAPPSLGKRIASAIDTVLTPAAFALDTAMLLRRSEALSVTDDLTRLYNARYLNIALRRETRLATRNNRPLSLLFIDLDGFKSINDSHGHLAGSRALVEAGAVIRGSARETDIVARFGGDEFALILPDTGSAGALAVAERIRERIARHSFLAGDGLDIHLTASVGVATLPDVAVAADELVQAADAAMYRVKDRGKNGIQVAVSSR
jgi:diguanylate cyclase (GGDEF)-like protein